MRPGKALHCCIIAIVLHGLVGSVATPTAADALAREGIVKWVYDGDTLQIQGVGAVRLIGIDCPEKVASDRDWKYLRMGCKDIDTLRASSRSTLKRVIRLCKGEKVKIRSGGDQRDRYGRLLAYVWLPDGQMLNRIILQEGRAIVYRRFNFSHKDDFIALENKARQQQLGIWRGRSKKSLKKKVDYSLDPQQKQRTAR